MQDDGDDNEDEDDNDDESDDRDVEKKGKESKVNPFESVSKPPGSVHFLQNVYLFQPVNIL